jgi:hypothetical protein
MTDIFFRKDNFKDEPWYDEMLVFCAIGICKAEKKEYTEPIREALAKLGYETGVFTKNGADYISGI